MTTLAQPNPEEAAWEVLIRARRSEWADFDPYDGLSGFASALPAKTVLTKRVVTQAVMRTSPRLRSLVGVSPHQEAYTTGLLISTAALLGDRAINEFSGELLEVLANLRVEGTGAWGYSFPVVTRAAQYGPDTPNLISTAFAGLGLLDLIEARGPRAASSLVIEAVDWMTSSLWDESLTGFRYYPDHDGLVYNASILGALFLARTSNLLGVEDVGLAERAVDRVIGAQQGDGSWMYGLSPQLHWVDNHHTAFILKALLLLPDQARPSRWDRAVDRGLSFFLEHLIAEDGAPKASPARRYPLDSLAAGQAVETLALAGQVLGDDQWCTSAWKVFRWLQAHLLGNDGRYAFRVGRFTRWPGAYLRWGEAHIALGAAKLAKVCDLGSERVD